MGWKVLWTRKAQKDILSLPKKQRVLILNWVRTNLDGCENPRAISDGKKLNGTDCGWRYRVGSYRLLCQLFDDELVIKVVRAGHRQGVYGKLPKL